MPTTDQVLHVVCRFRVSDNVQVPQGNLFILIPQDTTLSELVQETAPSPPELHLPNEAAVVSALRQPSRDVVAG